MRVYIAAAPEVGSEYAQELRERGIEAMYPRPADNPEWFEDAIEAIQNEVHLVVAVKPVQSVRYEAVATFLAGFAAGQGKPLILVGDWGSTFDQFAFDLAATGAVLLGGVVNGTWPGICRECGCTDELACPEGCAWADEEHTECTTHVLERSEPKGGGRVALDAE